MKKIERHVILGNIDIPQSERWFVEFNNYEGDQLKINAWAGGHGGSELFSFKTEYGVCSSDMNPINVFTKGFFHVQIPTGAKYTWMYCADKRIIATLRKAYDEANEKKHNGCGVFRIVDEKTADDIYSRNNIPTYEIV